MSGALFIAWRAGGKTSRGWGPVGRLEHDAGVYRFVYTRGALSLPGFCPFPGMSDLNAVYESEVLFPLFANRLLAKSRPEYDSFLKWGGFDDPDNPPDPIAILGVTEGMRQTDSLEVFPCPMPDRHGMYVNKFFLHGVGRLSSLELTRIEQLEVGDPLKHVSERSNQHDPNAVAVWTVDQQQKIGYVPRYLAKDVSEMTRECDPDSIDLVVERVNRDAPFQQRVLCRMDACWPQDKFQPCNRPEFQPIVGDLAPLQP